MVTGYQSKESKWAIQDAELQIRRFGHSPTTAGQRVAASKEKLNEAIKAKRLRNVSPEAKKQMQSYKQRAKH